MKKEWLPHHYHKVISSKRVKIKLCQKWGMRLSTRYLFRSRNPSPKVNFCKWKFSKNFPHQSRVGYFFISLFHIKISDYKWAVKEKAAALRNSNVVEEEDIESHIGLNSFLFSFITLFGQIGRLFLDFSSVKNVTESTRSTQKNRQDPQTSQWRYLWNVLTRTAECNQCTDLKKRLFFISISLFVRYWSTLSECQVSWTS